MPKKPITVDGRLDDMFVDDRDERLMAMPVDATLPRYGSNSLVRPPRALTEAEREAMDRVGLPTYTPQE